MKKMRAFVLSLFLTGMAAVFTLTMAGLAMADCPDGITGYWKLDETSGSPYTDFIGDNNAVTGTGDPDPAAGILINGAQRFVAASFDGLNVSASSAFNWTSEENFSIELWIQTDGDIDPSSSMVAVARDDGSMQWWIGMNSAGLASVFLVDTSGAAINGIGDGADISDGNPHHIVFVRDGVNNINLLYVDDNAAVEIPTTGGSGNFANGLVSDDAPLTMGYLNNDGSPGFYFDGYIDEVAIHKKALTADEIGNTYASAADYCSSSDGASAFAPYPDNTSGIWHLDEAAGPTYTDVIGGNNAVAPEGTGAPGDPDPAAGTLINGAQRFVAASPDGLQVSASSAFNWTSEEDFSIELWIQTDGDIDPSSTMVAIARDDGSMQWWIGMNSAGLASVFLMDTSGAAINGIGDGADISDGNPHHLVFVRDGVNNINTFYVDNTPVDIPTSGGSGNFANGLVSDDAPLTLGHLNNDGTRGYYFDGYIDEVAIYKRALTTDEIYNHLTAGTGGSSVDSLNPAPTANAGTEQSVATGVEVTLDGTSSTPGYANAPITGYQWAQTAGTTVSLSDATISQPSFTAPTEEGTLTFELTVTAADGQTSSAASVNVVVSTTAVTGPTANAGTDQSVTEGDTVTLDGRSSTAGAGGTLTYAWTQIDTTGLTVTLSDATVPQPTFTAPEVDENGAVLTFQLIVTEDGTSSAPATVNITIGDELTNPDADAGADQQVNEGTIVALDGSGSSAAAGATITTYAWTQIDTTGLTVELSDATVPQPTFTAPEVDSAGATLIFQLMVTDDGGRTATATVDIVVNDVASSDDGDGDGDGGGGGGCFIDSMSMF
jgi:predicted lipoprotein with Yx(FWY)xxD motif